MTLSRRRTRAFTLIEVMVAAAILGAGAAAVLSAYSTLMGIVEHQRRLAAAVNVAQGRLEELLLLPGTHAQLGGGVHAAVTVDDLGRDAAAVVLGSGFDVSYAVADDVPTPGYIMITVQTAWVESRGPKTLLFTAYRER